MNPERWRQIESLYQSAVALDLSEREAFLGQACADDEELRREVQSLLRHLSDDDSFRTSAAVHLAGPVQEVPSPIGSDIGPTGSFRLGRDVAIKVLPSRLANDTDRLRRFEREARLLATLNHPNIAAIYGFEQSHGGPALVLELVDGKTLAERVAAGPLSFAEACELSLQMADALEAAHDKGIIHRDLKPANIKITSDGKVKVLDFGLAKALSGDGCGPDLSQLPTLTLGGTEEGISWAKEPIKASVTSSKSTVVCPRASVKTASCLAFFR